MEAKSKWIPFREIDWLDSNNNRFNIDTRDFCCSYSLSNEPHPDYERLKKYPSRFFYTEEELKYNIERLYEESGGEKEWRCLMLISDDIRVNNWHMKYIRIFRLEDNNFIICNSEYQALPKNLLSCDVNLEVL